MTEKLLANIHWLGHDGFRIESGGMQIYIDPFKIEGGPTADLILITHEHFDHCSVEDVAKIQGENTTIVTVAAAAEMLTGTIEIVKPGEKLAVKGFDIETVPAYNTNKFRSPGVHFHPREAGHVGFIIDVDGRRIYHTGDTDCIPEMETFEVDVALLPVSGTYVMTAEEAIEAAALIKPKVAVPMHLGAGIGELSYADDFKTKAGVPVVVLPMEK